jgi:hypothetical protein
MKTQIFLDLKILLLLDFIGIIICLLLDYNGYREKMKIWLEIRVEGRGSRVKGRGSRVEGREKVKCCIRRIFI